MHTVKSFSRMHEVLTYGVECSSGGLVMPCGKFHREVITDGVHDANGARCKGECLVGMNEG